MISHSKKASKSMFLRIAEALQSGQDVSQLEGVSPVALLGEVQRNLGQIPVSLHPLGFVHFDLSAFFPSEERSFARLHLWDPRLSPPDQGGSMHDHTWRLFSWLIAGSLQNRNYNPVQDDRGEYSGTRVQYGATNSFFAAGRFSLQLLEDRILGPGSTYDIPSRIVHESHLLSQTALTFVYGIFDEQASSMGPLILRRGESAVHGTKLRTVLSRSEAERHLKAAFSLISDVF